MTLDGESVPESGIRAFSDSEDQLADAYEAAVHSADDLADLCFGKAEAAARLVVTGRQIAEDQDRLESLREEAEALNAQCRALDAEWRELWAQAPFEPLSPDEMLEWVTARRATLNAHARRETAERQLAALSRQEAETRTRLVDALSKIGVGSGDLAGQPLAVVLEVASDALREHEKAVESGRRLVEAHRQAVADADRERESARRSEAEWSEWQSHWAVAVGALGLDTTVDPEAVAAQVDTIDEMRSIVDKVNDLRHERIGKIEAEVTAFDDDVASLAETVAPDLVGLAPEDAVIKLERRLADALRLRDRATEKDEAIATLEQGIGEREAARRNAQEVIERLQLTAGVTRVDQFKVAIGKSDSSRELLAERTQILVALVGEGDVLWSTYLSWAAVTGRWRR